jgi:hypothetical protein
LTVADILEASPAAALDIDIGRTTTPSTGPSSTPRGPEIRRHAMKNELPAVVSYRIRILEDVVGSR